MASVDSGELGKHAAYPELVGLGTPNAERRAMRAECHVGPLEVMILEAVVSALRDQVRRAEHPEEPGKESGSEGKSDR